MVNAILASALFRVGLPTVLLAATLFRYNLLSFVYLLLLLVSPLLSGPSKKTPLPVRTKVYLLCVVSLSAAFCLAQLAYQILLLSTHAYEEPSPSECGLEQRLLSLFGLYRLNGISFVDCMRLVVADCIVLIFSSTVYIVCDKLEQQYLRERNSSLSPLLGIGRRSRYLASSSLLLLLLEELVVLATMAVAGTVHATLLSLVYFLAFLGVATWLGCSKRLAKGYRTLRVFLMLFAAFHYISLYIYQLDYSQEFLKPDSLEARLVGFVALRVPACNSSSADPLSGRDVRELEFFERDWTLFVHPLSVLMFYFAASTMTRLGGAGSPRAANGGHYRASRPPMRRSQSLFATTAPGSSGLSGDTGEAGSSGDSRRTSQRSHSSAANARQRRKSHRPDSMLLQNDRLQGYNSIGSAQQNLTVDGGVSCAPLNAGLSSTSATGGQDDNTQENSRASQLQSQQSRTGSNRFNRWRQLYAFAQHFVAFLFKGSYVITLIIMMAWSITYHSWLTFVLLLWSCLLWMMPNSRQACLKNSPALVLYAEILLIFQFIYSLDLTDEELPTFIGKINLNQVGFVKHGFDSYRALGIKIVYTVVFWLTLRQYVEQRREAICALASTRANAQHETHTDNRADLDQHQPPSPLTARHSWASATGVLPVAVAAPAPAHAGANANLRSVGRVCRSVLVRIWIWVVAVMLFVISLGGDRVVLYRIVYMVLFLFFILIYQFSYRIWIKVMYGFLLTVIIYSMMVLILIYTYQFENFAHYWEVYLHISIPMQKDIGLELYDSDPRSLLLKLLTPTIFLIVTIIQLHYFHKDFIRLNMQAYQAERVAPPTESTASTLTSPVDPVHKIQIDSAPSDDESPEPPTPDTVISKDRYEREKRSKSLNEHDTKLGVKLRLERLRVQLSELERIVLRLMEIHMGKLMFFSVFLLCVYDVCAMHVLYMGLAVIAMPLRGLRQFMLHCCALWTAILLVSKMIYQLKFVDSIGWETKCTSVYGLNTSGPFPYPFNETIDNRQWIGFMKTPHLTDYCKGYIALITLFTLHAMVKAHQHFRRHIFGSVELPPGVVWPHITRRAADRDSTSFFKFFVNYAFFKFGVEVCLVSMVACIGLRLDLYALLTALWLCCMFLLRRQTLARLWPFYVVYLCIAIPLQYLIAVGLPPGLCIEYPWYSEYEKMKEAVEWLFLPDYRNRLSHRKILVDCFQLILSCCQLAVFSIEVTEGSEHPAGSNAEIYNARGEFVGERPNPVPRFIGDKSYFNRIKTAVFFLFYWLTLAVMYLAGTNRISLFALFYILGCFFFLWNGNEFYLKPIKTLLNWWNSLLAFNVTVILMKCILQVLGCVYLQELAYKMCWFVQLLGIACLKKLGPKKTFMYETTVGECNVPTTEAGLLWDGICFAFLLLQKRLFTSYYFHHLIIEILAQQELSSRGAEVIHYLQMEKVKQQHEGEREIMEKIRMKMDRIRENQRKHREGEYVEPETHYQAIRSGDYYLFDDNEKPELLDFQTVRTSKEETPDDFDVKTKGLNAVLSNIMKGSSTLRARARTETGEEIGDSSGMSAIISIDRSTHSTTHSQASSSFPSTVITRPPTTVTPTTTTTTQRDATLRDALTDASADPPVSQTQQALAAASETDRTLLTQADSGPEADQTSLTWQERLSKYVAIMRALMNSMLVSATAKLHSFSGGYREVAKLLDKDKELVKQRYPDGLAILTEEHPFRFNRAAVYKPSSSEGLAQELLQIKKDLGEEASTEAAEKREPLVAQFLNALIYAFYARTEIVCYLGIVYNQICTATLLSLPLPLMVFLWGSLSVPRPSKTFWITVITYTEAIVVVKYLFQFDFFKWDSGGTRVTAFDPSKMLGIEKRSDDSNYALYDLMLLFLVFLHRFVLKSLGLWKDTDRTFFAEVNSASPSDASRMQLCIENTQNFTDITAAVGSTSGITKMGTGTKHKQSARTARSNVTDDELSDEDLERTDVECDSEDDQVISQQFGYFLKGMHFYLEPFKTFFTNLLHPPYQVATDVYAWMFFCDFFNFLVMVFGYWAFGTGGNEEGVTAYFEKNEVPIPFLIMLLAQFGLIVIDRALYLRKYIFGKLLFQQVIVVLIHIWMFFALPAISQKSFAEEKNLPPKLWYFTKCIYFLLSAYQIRCGYPTRILGNFFTKKYNYLNYFLFKGYMIVPFLYELRSLMDWIWTDTSMALTNWLKMEDIFASIFQLKCQRRAEEEYPKPRGAKLSSLIKYGMGGTLLFLIILIIWFPLLLFSLGNTVGHSLPPQECQIQLSIGGYEPLFTISAQKNNMQQIPSSAFDELYRRYKSETRPQNFLANYDQSDVVVAMLNGNSTAVWSISPPSQEALRRDLLNASTRLELKMKLTFFREKSDSDADPTTTLEVRDYLTDKEARDQMAAMLAKDAKRVRARERNDQNRQQDRNLDTKLEASDKAARMDATLPQLLPKFIHIPRKGPAKKVLDFEHGNNPTGLRNLSVQLLYSDPNSTLQGEWWEVRTTPCTKDDPYPFIQNLDVCSYLTVVVFADKVFPQALSSVSSYGIVGLYTTFVLLVSRFLRGFIANTSTRIMFDDMPNVDRVLQLCMDIYLVRESKELALEEDLFAKLVFLYRSPETLIKWTRITPPPAPPRAPGRREQAGPPPPTRNQRGEHLHPSPAGQVTQRRPHLTQPDQQ